MFNCLLLNITRHIKNRKKMLAIQVKIKIVYFGNLLFCSIAAVLDSRVKGTKTIFSQVIM